MCVIGASNLTPKSQVSIKWGKYVTSVTGQHYPLLKKVLLAHSIGAYPFPAALLKLFHFL